MLITLVGVVGLYLWRTFRLGRARNLRSDADGGSVFLHKSAMEMAYWMLGPLMSALAELGVTPNMVTLFSLVPTALAAVAAGFGWFGLACVLGTGGALCDLVDGLVALLLRGDAVACPARAAHHRRFRPRGRRHERVDGAALRGHRARAARPRRRTATHRHHQRRHRRSARAARKHALVEGEGAAGNAPGGRLRKLFAQWMRHNLASMAATVVDYSVMVTLVEAAGFRPVAATAVSAFCGALTNFTLGRFFTYRVNDTPVIGQTFRYALVSGV